MNNPRRSRSRSPLVCTAVRRWESAFGPDSGHARLTRGHLAQCAECQAFFEEDPVFEQSLRRDAAHFTPDLADHGLEGRILRAVQAATTPARPEPRRPAASVAWAGALLAAGMAFAAAVTVIWNPWAASPTTGSLTQGPAPHVSPGAVDAGSRPGLAPSPALVKWLTALERRREGFDFMAQNPLERELVAVRMDAKAFVGFFALNFLPSQPVLPPTPGQS